MGRGTLRARMCSPLIALLALQGCAANDHRGIRPLRPQELATAPYDGTITAKLKGSLMYEGGCLLFREDGSMVRRMPVWPTGSVFNGTSLIFHEPGKAEQPILIAQQFIMEGREVRWSQLQAATYASFQQQCGGEPFLVSEVGPAD